MSVLSTDIKVKPPKLAFIDTKLLVGFAMGFLVSGLFARLSGELGIKG